MEQWNLTPATEGASPKILTSCDDGRAVLVELAAGESLGEHQVHERAWVSVLAGEVDIRLPHGATTSASAPALLVFEPGERHSVHANTRSSLLLLLTPWPGIGHPGATPLDLKAGAHALAMEKHSAA
ncbi:MAG: hypothetical protein J7513_09545 [Solirubrobacteraceae bacterium]|nr:hypothetical protein [Solirubrobacteraceae bacterium]